MTNQRTTADQIMNLLREISTFDIDANANLKNDAIQSTITQNRSHIDSVVALAKSLKDNDWSLIPAALQSEALQQVSIIHQKMNQITNFSIPPDRTPHDQAARISQDVFSGRPETQSKPPLLYYAHQLSLFTGLLLASDKSRYDALAEASRLKDRVHEVENTLQKQVSEMGTLLENARETAGNIGAERHSTEFGSLAKNHERHGRIWLAVTLLFFLVTGISAWKMFDISTLLDLSAVQKNLTLAQLAPRIIILSLTYSAAVWSARVYKSHRHLHVQNKHRETALQTFRTFVGAAENDPHVKNAILLECTRTIFAHTPSGYLESESPPATTAIFDIVKSITKNEGSK